MNLIRTVAALILASAAAWAQNVPISSIRISTQPSGARFYVDGQPYLAPQVFLWPQGSKHIVQFPTMKNPDGTSTGCQISQDEQFQYCFGGWTESTGALVPAGAEDQIVTASPSVTWLQANLTVKYKVRVRFSAGTTTEAPTCGGAPGNAPQDILRGGLVYIAGVCFGEGSDIWSEGSITLNAFPYPGFVFTGWNINGQQIDSYLKTYKLVGPITLQPQFQLAKRVQFITNPLGMQLLIDRTPTPTSAVGSLDYLSANFSPCKQTLNLPPMPPITIPALCFGEFDFLPGTKHVVSAVTPQLDSTGHWWVLDKFSNGQDPNTAYVADSDTMTRALVTANFLPGVQAAFVTDPSGLKLTVDGRDNWQQYNFIWGAGTAHVVTASDTQVDANGRKWTFTGWSNGGPATQSVVTDPNEPNLRLIASFSTQGQLKVLTNPPGITLKIDGEDCITPCVADRPKNTNVAISAPDSVKIDATSRLDFLGWSDGAKLARTFTLNGQAQTIFANYSYAYLMAVTSDPEGGADFRFNPASPDGFYLTNTDVTVTAVPRPGFKFRRWNGDLEGVYNIGTVNVSGPRGIIAGLDRIPYIAPAGVRNAAGDTPDGSVAPGSIISIFGESLAGRVEVGPTNPLSQTLADVVVTVNDRILPLMFVSPQQINAQLLSDLPDGTYTLKVRWTGKPDVNGTFTISRNAPGLFARVVDSQSWSVAVHEDGSLVTAGSPAARGEMITLYGTGFGPYTQKVLDGFAIPGNAEVKVADPVVVQAGDTSIQPEWSGAVYGVVGLVITRFRVPETTPAENVDLTVTVNGKPSNKVILPVRE